MKSIYFIVFAALLSVCLCDLYMQNPRGSNNRLHGNNANRDNNNRLFDSQNNAKGGYCWGPKMTFYQGSLLRIEWTNQHSCGNDKNHCNLVMQYMCESYLYDGDEIGLVRDGLTNGDSPTLQEIANGEDPNVLVDVLDETDEDDHIYPYLEGTQYKYGMHESYQYYQNCNARERNKGLYTADQNMGGRNSARSTRQNNNGNQNGYECPEERDYYPYWHPTPWKDIVIFATDESNCPLFTSESQNVAPKHYCQKAELANDYKPTVMPTGDDPFDHAQPNYETACIAAGHKWVEVDSWGIDAPLCLKAQWSRDNHLGNGIDGFANHFNWTIPTDDRDISSACVLRIRYNISTTDYDVWSKEKDYNYMYNEMSFPNAVTDDPHVTVDGLKSGERNLTLAIDTSQFGRTFEDRTHIFAIAERPDDIPNSARIWNLNVRGKRGNIVQTYPATEYDFTPNYLTIRSGDYIHFQWTGCDNNPAGNDGEGTDQTDRSNIVQLANLGIVHPCHTDTDVSAENAAYLECDNMFDSQEEKETFAFLDQDAANCPSMEELLANNNNDQDDADRDPSNCHKLNAASQYFNYPPKKFEGAGTYYYMASRNNNFSNRAQKAVIKVELLLPTWAIAIVAIGGILFLGSIGAAGLVLYNKKNPGSISFLDKM